MGRRPEMMQSSVTIMPYMMDPGEDRIIANAIYEGLTKPGHYEDPVIPIGNSRTCPGNLGRYDPVSARCR